MHVCYIVHRISGVNKRIMDANEGVNSANVQFYFLFWLIIISNDFNFDCIMVIQTNLTVTGCR